MNIFIISSVCYRIKLFKEFFIGCFRFILKLYYFIIFGYDVLYCFFFFFRLKIIKKKKKKKNLKKN
mgnify:CR=1 FL=1